MTFPVQNISISINCSKDIVYAFAANAENFPKWLAFVKSISKRSALVWDADTDLGKIEIEMTPQNELGVIDHRVKLSDGNEVSNPLRVIENHNGCEVIFSLFKLPGKSVEDFEDDGKLVKADLLKLKQILESDNQ